MICNKCGFSLSEGSNFCTGCGIKIEIDQKVATDDLSCNFCAEKLIAGNKFCTKCGKPNDTVNTATHNDEQSQLLYNECLKLLDTVPIDAAMQKFTEAIQLHPHPAYYYWRGYAYAALHFYGDDDLTNVIEDMTSAITLSPDSPSIGGAYYLRALAYHKGSGRKDETIRDLEKALHFGCEVDFANIIGLKMSDTKYATNILNILKKGALKGFLGNLFN